MFREARSDVTLAGRIEAGTARRWSELGAAVSWRPWIGPLRVLGYVR